MNRLTSHALMRSIELLLLVALWETYGGARSMGELIALFVHQPKLLQVGTLTALAVIASTVGVTISEITAGVVKLVDHFRNHRETK